MDRAPREGACCACGDDSPDDVDTVCPNRADRTHCDHWYEIEESPAPSPDPAHAGLLAAWQRARHYAANGCENCGHPMAGIVDVASAGDALAAALRAAPPSAGRVASLQLGVEAVEAAWKEGYRVGFGRTCAYDPDAAYARVSAARRAAGQP